MRDALWRLEPHAGRLGPELALAGISPFKRPVLLMRPGATFTPEGPGPWGRMLTGLHPDRPEVVLNARHIAIPFREAAPAAEAA
jgi:CRISPR-associated protein Csm4